MTRLQRLPIATRMLFTSLTLVLIILPLAGALLSYNFRQAVDAAFDERLEALLNVVLAGVAFDAERNALVSSRTLGDPRFDRVFSGWYWQVTDGNERYLASRSLWDQRLPVSSATGLESSTLSGPNGEQLRKLERDITLPNLPATLHIAVAADISEVDAEVARFFSLLFASLLTLGILLLLGIWFQIRWGLSPLRRIRKSLGAVERGEQVRLESDFPEELAQLADTINTVLERDKQIISRGRHAAGNLAHAMKTPISVMTAMAETLPAAQNRLFSAELRRLNDAVRHHLARASAAGPTALRSHTDLHSALSPVIDGITRLAQRRKLQFDRPELPPIRLRIDAQDLQEIVGNLLDNAVHWAESRIEMVCLQIGDQMQICVSDDGPGMLPEEREAALLRGGRLDEQRSGSGLGLAIVMDLVTLYDGHLNLDQSTWRGLRASVILPLDGK